MEADAHTTAHRTRSTGFARVGAALACLLLAGLVALPPGGLDAIAAPTGELAPCGEEGGHEPEMASAAGRLAHSAPSCRAMPDSHTARTRRVVVRPSVPLFCTSFDHRSVPFRLRC